MSGSIRAWLAPLLRARLEEENTNWPSAVVTGWVSCASLFIGNGKTRLEVLLLRARVAKRTLAKMLGAQAKLECLSPTTAS